MTIGIYCIENLINSKRYIGKSVNIERRFNDHRRMMRRDTMMASCNRHLWGAAKMCGMASFRFFILEIHMFVDSIRLSERELYWQDFYQSHNPELGYNLLRESGGVVTHSEETRCILSAKNKGRRHTNEARISISKAQTGRKYSKEWCEAISKATKGRVISKSQREDISKTLAGRTLTKEHCENISKSLKGHVTTQATKDAISISKKGKPDTRTDEGKLGQKEAVSRYSYERYSIDGELLCVYSRISDAVRIGFKKDSIIDACNGRQKTYKGFVWKKIPKIELPL